VLGVSSLPLNENGNILSFYNIVYYTIAKGCVYVGELFDIHGLFYLTVPDHMT
jgi:hypothetical protein